MLSKETYTKIFLQQKEYSLDDANVKLHLYKWWQTHRSKESGGLRLSWEGYQYLVEDLSLQSYDIPFTDPIELSPQTIIFFDRYMDCPYYLTNQCIVVFSEKKSFELYMFSDDIRKYGLVKAMNRRNKDSQTVEDDEENA